MKVTTHKYDPSKVKLKDGKDGGKIAVISSPPKVHSKPSKYIHPDDLPSPPEKLTELTEEEIIEHDQKVNGEKMTPQKPWFLELFR